MSLTSLQFRFLRTVLAFTGGFVTSARAQDAASLAAPRTVTIAVVKDGSSTLLDTVDAAFRDEARTLTAGRATLVFKEGGVLDAGWREGASARALDAALADPGVNYVLALGVRVTAAATANRPLTKPVLGALVRESDLVPLPVNASGHSQKENFAVVALPSRAADQLADLRAAVPFTALHVLIDEFLAPDRAALAAWGDRLAKTLGTPVTVVPLGTNATDALAALGADARTVLLFPAVRMDGFNRAALLQGLTARKISVLGFLGQPDVEAGALAGVLPNPRSALARRLAINLDQLIAGASPADLPLQVNLPRQLFLNETTASAIGFALNFTALRQATLIGTSAIEAGQPLTFSAAIATALEKNFDLRAQQSATESSRQSTRAATGALLPQLTATQSYQQIDNDRALASGGSQPQSSHRAGLGLSQVIFNDEAFTRAKAAREAQRGATFLEQAERLNTINDAGQAYLKLLSARASLRVAEENLQVTQRNLELARLRLRVGTSGPEEGYRFESLAAQQRAEVTSAHAQADQARIALNHVLAVDSSTRWQTQDVTLEDPAFTFMTARVVDLVRDRQQLEHFRAFAATYALAHSPDLLALEQNVKTQRLTAGEKTRRGYTPKISASVSYSRALRQDFAGPSLADQFAAAGVPVRATTADRDDVTIGITASLPIFTGGSLTAEARKARADLRQLEISREGSRDAVIAQTHSALYATESAYTNIDLSRRSADLAAQNLAVVQDKYEQGAVSIVTLLDAQNSAFAQRQSAEAAVYKFLSELLRFQRALGWIEVTATPAEKDAWARELEQAIAR